MIIFKDGIKAMAMLGSGLMLWGFVLVISYKAFFTPDVTIARNNIHCHCPNTAQGAPECCRLGCSDDCESPKNVCTCKK